MLPMPPKKGMPPASDDVGALTSLMSEQEETPAEDAGEDAEGSQEPMALIAKLESQLAELKASLSQS